MPLQSPETDTSPGVARPSSLLGDESKPDASESNPERQVSQVMVRMQQLDRQIDQLASTYPAAAPNLRKAQKALRDAAGQIVATGSGSQQETPNPRMLG